MAEHVGPVKITVSDPESGRVLEERTISNNYVIVTAGNRYIKHIQMMGKTHMVAIAVARHDAKEQGEPS